MKNIDNISTMSTKLLNSPAAPQLLNKLSGDNITNIVIAAIAAGTIYYVCANGGELEIDAKNKKIKLTNSCKAA